jgi:site-specific DNA-methyltransferase (adenine-specific)
VSDPIDKVLSGDRKWVVECGDCLAVLKTMPDVCVDACVTDPPYGLGTREPTVDELIAYLQGSSLDVGGDFMARDWMLPTVAIWREVWRVLKPGGYLLSFAGTRTVDLIGIGIRAAGFELKDEFSWTYGQGFPHGIDVSKAIDKLKGAKRRVVGQRALTGNAAQTTKEKGGTYAAGTDARGQAPKIVDVTAPESEEAKRWDGFNTALKPCREPIIVARKPFRGTVAANILKHGTGAMNIGACRVGGGYGRPESWYRSGHSAKPGADKIAAPPGNGINAHELGRWPGNILLSHAGPISWYTPKKDTPANVVKEILAFYGVIETVPMVRQADLWYAVASSDTKVLLEGVRWRVKKSLTQRNGVAVNETGGDSEALDGRERIFEVAAQCIPDCYVDLFEWSCDELGCDDSGCMPWCPVRILDEQTNGRIHSAGYATDGAHCGGKNVSTSVAMVGPTGPKPTHRYGDVVTASRFFNTFPHESPWFYSAKADRAEREIGCERLPRGIADRGNTCPCVKPLAVMQWLCRLVTQPGGLVLDPFCGSGSTGVAALREGFRFVGIERDPDHVAIGRARIVGDAPLLNSTGNL